MALIICEMRTALGGYEVVPILGKLQEKRLRWGCPAIRTDEVTKKATEAAMVEDDFRAKIMTEKVKNPI